jgi:acyl-coenzyme A thioesterase PaaI-like protein
MRPTVVLALRGAAAAAARGVSLPQLSVPAPLIARQQRSQIFPLEGRRGFTSNNSKGDNIQDTFAAQGICWGCGAANESGLRIKSTPVDWEDVSGHGDVEVTFEPAEEHQAWPGFVSGAIIGSVMDCHMNNTAAYSLRAARGDDSDNLPCTVTAWYRVDMKKPTPFQTLRFVARVVPETLKEDRTEVEVQVFAGDSLTAKGRGLFVEVKEGHPAYHRW